MAVTGPILLLLALYPLWHYDWSTELVYVALALMIGVAVPDLVRPVRRHCSIASGGEEP